MWRSLTRKVRTWIEPDQGRSWGEQAELAGALIIVGLLCSVVVVSVV